MSVLGLLLAVLLVVAAEPCVAGVANEPRFSVPVFLDVGSDPLRIIAADLNGDSKADLATVDLSSSTVSVLFGRGDGNFRKRVAYRTARRPTGITAADVNGDGSPDLVTISRDRAGSASVFLNAGAGRFARAGTYSSGAGAYSVAAADVNRDGTTDLATAHYDRRHLVVLLGSGGGRFTIGHS